MLVVVGVVSEVHFANLTKLTELLASPNRLTLEVREDWIPPFKLIVLLLGSWNLGLKFPSWLCAQNHLEYLDISNTGILIWFLIHFGTCLLSLVI
jgi:hypothetical protein